MPILLATLFRSRVSSQLAPLCEGRLLCGGRGAGTGLEVGPFGMMCRMVQLRSTVTLCLACPRINRADVHLVIHASWFNITTNYYMPNS